MSTDFMSYSIYKELYKRFIDPSRISDMVSLARDLKNKFVIDLCAGGCRLSTAVSAYAPKKVIAIDRCAAMMEDFHGLNVLGQEKWICEIPEALAKLKPKSVDVAFCQQGVNYWFDSLNLIKLARVFKKGGLFIFNTFWKKPSEKVTSKRYVIDGSVFIETSVMIGNTVYHTQIRHGFEPHATSFTYISPKEFKERLSPYFKVTSHRDGGTEIYKCIRK